MSTYGDVLASRSPEISCTTHFDFWCSRSSIVHRKLNNFHRGFTSESDCLFLRDRQWKLRSPTRSSLTARCSKRAKFPLKLFRKLEKRQASTKSACEGRWLHQILGVQSEGGKLFDALFLLFSFWFSSRRRATSMSGNISEKLHWLVFKHLLSPCAHALFGI